MNKEKLFNHLQAILKESIIKKDEPLKNYTYTKIGGPADILVFPKCYGDIETIYTFTRDNSIPLTTLGNGSNVLITDNGIRGVVLNLTKLNKIETDNDIVTAQCGARIIDVSYQALESRLTGLEFACGIPGSVGGALYMNAGAYGGEIADVLASALVIKEGKVTKIPAAELNLSYRHSAVEEKGFIVLAAHFQLQPGDYTAMKAKMDELTYLRESKQPLEYPSCGSVFKRPPGYFAGKLIQDSKLQGFNIGGAEVSTKHAGFIVNKDRATASDYVAVIRHVQKTVKENFGVDLETEVRIIGD
ncbi:UDP-N-acetylmuramate dehydrogenase [Pullulanibacillus camelliae]|nr:UDP-N-acetylmuramate dehydrogenase [Pullulanibacillus camelliae]